MGGICYYYYYYYYSLHHQSDSKVSLDDDHDKEDLWLPEWFHLLRGSCLLVHSAQEWIKDGPYVCLIDHHLLLAHQPSLHLLTRSCPDDEHVMPFISHLTTMLKKKEKNHHPLYGCDRPPPPPRVTDRSKRSPTTTRRLRQGIHHHRSKHTVEEYDQRVDEFAPTGLYPAVTRKKAAFSSHFSMFLRFDSPLGNRVVHAGERCPIVVVNSATSGWSVSRMGGLAVFLDHTRLAGWPNVYKVASQSALLPIISSRFVVEPHIIYLVICIYIPAYLPTYLPTYLPSIIPLSSKISSSVSP